MKDYLKTCCPICGRNMYVYQYGYRCERCGFTIQAFICNRHINRDEAESIILHDTNILDGFSKNDGKVFSSIPVIKGSTVTLDNTICHCWYGEGRIYVDTKWFKCDKRNICQRPCFFAHANGIRRCYDGHLLTISEIRELIYKKTLEFSTRDLNVSLQTKQLSLQTRHIKLS